MYKLLVCDLDGTLLDDRGNFPENNLIYIKKITDAGVAFAICSGRSYLSLARFEKTLGLDKPGCFGIGFNGAMVYETASHKILLDERLARETAFEIISAARNYNVELVVYDGDRLIAEKATPFQIHYAERAGLELQLIDSYGDLPNDVSKILLLGEPENLQTAARDFSGMIGGRATQFFSSPGLYEFLSPTANKGTGLKFLAAHLGIPIERTVAVGDQMNDIDMIRAAGLGVAVANALPAVKAAADYVSETTNNYGILSDSNLFEKIN